MVELIFNYIKVDYNIYGCLLEKRDFFYIFGMFFIGLWFEDIDYLVCLECRFRGNICVFFERGEFCFGLVMRVGCDVRCFVYGIVCIGCWGVIGYDVVWFDFLVRVFREKGLIKEEIFERMRM